MKEKKLLLLGFNSALLITLVMSVLIISSGISKIQTAIAAPTPAPPTNPERISPGDVWQQVYQQLPNLPRENKYINKETGKVADNNTLANRLIRYHIYTKGRAPTYRLDWKLTLADYLGANEIMYDSSYPGNDTLGENPIEGDRKAIASLNRSQRNALVQTLVNIFTPETTPQPKTNN